MKMKMLVIIGALLCSFAVTNTEAQTITNAPTSADQFYNVALDWTLNINTNLHWEDINLEVATGYKQVTGIGAANTLDLQYDIGRYNAGVNFQFSGVGSPVNNIEAQFGYAVIQDHDFKVEPDLRFGYDNQREFVLEPCLFISKLITKNTFAKGGLSLPLYTKGKLSTTPSIFIEGGFGHMKQVQVKPDAGAIAYNNTH